MPSESGKLSVGELQRIIAWIQLQEGKATQSVGACSACGNEEWMLSDTMFCLMPHNGVSVVVGSKVQPVVTIICKRCGLLRLFNALEVGIVPKQPKEVSADA